MLVRTLTGPKPKTAMPKGAVDTHMHMYLPEFMEGALEAGVPAGETPTPEQYRRFMGWLGIDRVIVVQGNAHRKDNANILACIGRMGEIARGVAAIDGATSDAEMQRLTEGGCVGARIMDLPGGAVGLDELEAVDSRAAAFGWSMVVQFDGTNLLEHESRLAGLKCRWTLDHHGKFFCGVTPDDPRVDALKRLIDRGNCWFKLAACYESSKAGGPAFEDIAAVARAIAAYAPERIVWGSNWPHNMAKAQESYPDDAALLDTVLGWLPSDRARHLALVENPESLFGFPPVDVA